MGRLPLRSWSFWAVVVALTGMAVLAADYRSYAERTTRTTDALRSMAARSVLRDRLLGTELPELRARSLGDEVVRLEPERSAVLWLVDPEGCVSCLARAGHWRRLASRFPGRATVVLLGTDGTRGRRIRQSAGLAGRVLVDPADRLRSRLPMDHLASAMLVTDDGGRVTMAGARSLSSACDWSFFAQAAALLLEGETAAIRAGS